MTVHQMTQEDEGHQELGSEEVSNEVDLSAQEAQAVAEMAEELDRLKRLGVFSTFVAAVMMSFVFLPLFYPILLIVVGILYLCWPCLLNLAFLGSSASDGHEFSTAESSMLDYATDINHDRSVDSDFDKVRSEIRSCEVSRLASTGPPEGIYKVVYAAEYFGRPLRSEGEVCLKFQPASNGWEIQGLSRSTSGPASAIREGFLNAQGEMYWLADGRSSDKPIQYYGNFEFDTNELHDGDFCTRDNKLKGRIVRLSLHKATKVDLETVLSEQNRQSDWAITDIEMVTRSNEAADDVLDFV